MKSHTCKLIVLVLFGFIPFQLFPQTTNKETKVKETRFTIQARGEKVFAINVPKGVKKIRAHVSMLGEATDSKPGLALSLTRL